ncbi:Protein of unknown function [Gryllus bimaculatus]|nr:Protein of unknown function [Gryllus bimaculatus]
MAAANRLRHLARLLRSHICTKNLAKFLGGGNNRNVTRHDIDNKSRQWFGATVAAAQSGAAVVGRVKEAADRCSALTPCRCRRRCPPPPPPPPPPSPPLPLPASSAAAAAGSAAASAATAATAATALPPAPAPARTARSGGTWRHDYCVRVLNNGKERSTRVEKRKEDKESEDRRRRKNDGRKESGKRGVRNRLKERSEAVRKYKTGEEMEKEEEKGTEKGTKKAANRRVGGGREERAGERPVEVAFSHPVNELSRFMAAFVRQRPIESRRRAAGDGGFWATASDGR